MAWGDETLHYTDEGAGRAVLFIHGLGGNANNWLHQRRSIARHHRVIAVDLPGHGRSTGRGIAFEQYALAAEAVLDNLGVRSVSVVGLAMGARVGIALAARLPRDVTALTLVNAYLELPPVENQRRVKLYDLLLSPGGDRKWATELLNLMGVSDRPGIVRGFLASLAQIDPQHIHAVFHQVLRADQQDELRALGIPVQIMVGELDRLVPEQCTERLHELARGSSIRRFAGSGHLPYLEEPAVFTDALEAFLHISER